MQRRYTWLLLLLFFGAVLLCVISLPYLRRRLFVEATMRGLPPPATAQQISQAVAVDLKCRETHMITRYRTDSTWTDLITYYRAAFDQQPGWSYQSYESGIRAAWNLEPSYDDTRPSLTVTIGPLLPTDSLFPQMNDGSAAAPGAQYYRIEVEYIDDQRAYHVCFRD